MAERTAQYADYDQQDTDQEKYDRLLLHMAEVRQAIVATNVQLIGLGGQQASWENLSQYYKLLQQDKDKFEKRLGTDAQADTLAFVSSRPGR